MKTVLVLTDFSESARNAAETAIKVAEKLRANILLLNTYIIAEYVVTTQPMPWPIEYYKVLKQDSIDQLKLEEKRLAEIIKKQEPSDQQILVSSISMGGSLAHVLPDLLKDKDIIMIMMGGRHNKGSELLFGSDIIDVINEANRPVFIISVVPLILPAKNVVFATDLSEEDICSLNYLICLSKYFDFHIHVCHVTDIKSDSTPSDKLSDIEQFKSKIDQSKLSCLSFIKLEGNHIKKELTKFSNAIDADILILTHKRHSFFWQILHETPATDLARFHTQPLLILPCSADPSFFDAFLPLHSFIPNHNK